MYFRRKKKSGTKYFSQRRHSYGEYRPVTKKVWETIKQSVPEKIAQLLTKKWKSRKKRKLKKKKRKKSKKSVPSIATKRKLKRKEKEEKKKKTTELDLATSLATNSDKAPTPKAGLVKS